jgi:hypothetical protein
VDCAKRFVVPRPEQRHQLLVGPQPKQRRCERDSSSREYCGSLEG